MCKQMHNCASVAATRMRDLAAALPKAGMNKKDKECIKLADAADPAATKLFTDPFQQEDAETPSSFTISAMKREDWVQF